MDIKELKKILAGFCVATLMSGPGISIAGSQSG
jgi:radical SAM modification target selenobiotic family peptide